MKKLLSFGLALLLIFTTTAKAQNNEIRKDRIIASYLLAFGILPEEGEINYWINDPLSLKTVDNLIEEHKKNIRNNVYLADRAIRNSYQDAFGRQPRSDEYVTWRPLKLSYTELMERHMQYLKEFPQVFTDVIKLSYRNHFNREASTTEINNWKSWGIRSYFSISQEHQKNIRSGMFAVSKNPGTKLLSNPKSGVKFEPSKNLAAELANYSQSNFSKASGNCISVGGGNVIATGGGNVIATGGGNVISTGGGN